MKGKTKLGKLLCTHCKHDVDYDDATNKIVCGQCDSRDFMII